MRATALITLLGTDRVYEWRTGDLDLHSASVTLAEGKAASTLKLELIDPRLELANELPLPQRRSRVAVEAWFGYGVALEKVFTGYLSSLNAGGLPGRTSLTAVDKGKGLRRVAKSRNLTGFNADAVIRQLAQEDDLRVDLTRANLSGVSFSSVLQMGESNMDIIGKLAEECGHEVYVRGETLFVKEVGRSDDGRVLRVPFGPEVANGFSFQVDELTRRTTPNVFDVDGGLLAQADDLDQEAAEVMTRLSNTGLVLANEGTPEFTSQAEQRSLKAQAKARRLFEGNLDLTRAYPEVDVDWQVLLENFGPRFSGAWNVSQVDHDLTRGTTSLQIYNGGSGG
mgnify:CR=1 FL=1